MEAYFDESGSHFGAPILSVGGYLFEPEQRVIFDAEWSKLLSDFQVPYFHMVDCHSGDPPFDKLPRELRQAMVVRASKLINKFMAYGIVVAVNENQYDQIVPRHPLIGNAYSFIARQTFNAVRIWADREEYGGAISYFFEAGHKHQSDADFIMREHSRNAAVKAGARYQSHSFLRKEGANALQAADLLAWHYCDDWKRNLRGEDSRESYADLIMNAPIESYWHFQWTEELLLEQAEKIRRLIERYPEAGSDIQV